MRVCPPKTLNSGWANSKVAGAKFKKIRVVAPIYFMPTLFRKRAGTLVIMSKYAVPSMSTFVKLALPSSINLPNLSIVTLVYMERDRRVFYTVCYLSLSIFLSI